VRERERETETETETERDRDRDRERQRETERKRETERDRQKEREIQAFATENRMAGIRFRGTRNVRESSLNQREKVSDGNSVLKKRTQAAHTSNENRRQV